MITNLRMELFEALVITDIEVILVTMMPCCRCWLGQGLGAPGAAGGGGGQAARAQVRAVNQEKALVRTFFVIVNSADGSIAALVVTMTLSAVARAAAGASCVSTPAPPRSTCRRWWASRRCWPAPSPTSTTTRWATSHQSLFIFLRVIIIRQVLKIGINIYPPQYAYKA